MCKTIKEGCDSDNEDLAHLYGVEDDWDELLRTLRKRQCLMMMILALMPMIRLNRKTNKNYKF